MGAARDEDRLPEVEERARARRLERRRNVRRLLSVHFDRLLQMEADQKASRREHLSADEAAAHIYHLR